MANNHWIFLKIRDFWSPKGYLDCHRLRASHRDRHYVGVPCFYSLENQKTRKHQNQSLELQDLVLLFSERDLSNVCLQRFILCVLSIGFRLVIKCRCLFVCLVELIHQNMKDLGKIYRMEEHLFHWAME